MNLKTELSGAEMEAEKLLRAFFRAEAPRTLPPLSIRPASRRPLVAWRKSYVGLAASIAVLACGTAFGSLLTLSPPMPVAKGPLKDVPPTAKSVGPKQPPSHPSPRPPMPSVPQ